MKDYTYAEKEKFEAALRQQTDNAKVEIDKLEASMDKLSAQAQADAKKRIAELKDESSKLDGMQQKVKDSTESGWHDLTTDVDAGLVKLNDGLKDTESWIKSKLD